MVRVAVSAVEMAATVTVNDVLDGHVVLDLECLDRIYLNGYVPNLQVGGQVVSFMTQHLGYPIPSPAILEKIGTGFRRAVGSFAADNEIPVVRFGKDDRKIDVMRPYLAAQAATGRPGVAAIGVAQEFARVFLATKHTGDTTGVWFSFTKADRRVTCYYFYVWDDDFGPAFVKVCAYFPYPMKIWINGHEWAKRQAAKAGIGFTELSNGFASATDPAGAASDLRPARPRRDRGVRRTLVVDPAVAADRARPRRRLLVGAVDAAGRDLAHPGVRRTPPCPRVLRGAGGRQPRHRPPGADRADLQTRTAARTPGGRSVQDQDRHLRHRGQRQRLLPALPHQAVFEGRARAAHRDRDQRSGRPGRARDGWPISTSCRPAPVRSTPLCSILNVSVRAASWRVQPLSGSHGPPSPRMAGGPRPYGSATLGSRPWPAPCAPPCSAVTGITNKSLRALMTGLLGGTGYTMNQASYDLGRLRVNGLITRIPGHNRYRLTDDGLRFAIFYTKLHDRLLRPLLAADQPPAPPPLRKALHTINIHITEAIDQARLLPNAA